MSRTVLFCWLLIVIMASVSIARNDFHCLLETDLPGAKLFLIGGLARLFYYPIGAEGRNAEAMAEGEFQARQYMTAHDGDWCVCLIRCDQDTICIGWAAQEAIELAWPDGRTVQSEIALAVDTPAETQFWTNERNALCFHDGCRYARTRTGMFVLYVRFPESSCLSDKGDDQYRWFREKPVSMRLRTKGGDQVQESLSQPCRLRTDQVVRARY